MKKVDISFTGSKPDKRNYHMVITKPEVTEAINLFDLKAGDIFYIVKDPDLNRFYFPYSEITESFIDGCIEKGIKEGQMFGVTFAGIVTRDGELKKSHAPQVYWNYWLHEGELIKMEHTVPGFY